MSVRRFKNQNRLIYAYICAKRIYYKDRCICMVESLFIKHVGRYDDKDLAMSYLKTLKDQGESVFFKETVVYDIFVRV